MNRTKALPLVVGLFAVISSHLTAQTLDFSSATYFKKVFSAPAGFDHFGAVLAASGDTVVVGQRNNGDLRRAEVYVYDSGTETWSHQQTLVGSNSETGDRFAATLDISGDIIVIGAYEEDGSGTGVNPASNNSLLNAGAAYVFERDPGTGVWTEVAYLKASNSGSGDQFGWAVAINGDTVAVGAPGEDGNGTAPVNSPTASGNNSGDGNGAVYVYTRDSGTGTWSQQAYLKGSVISGGESLGQSLNISGDDLICGSRDNGSRGRAFVFTRDPGTEDWSEQDSFAFGSEFDDFSIPYGFGDGGLAPRQVAIDGDLAVVGAPREDGSGTGIDPTINNSASDAGAAYVYVRDVVAGTWSLDARLKASNTGSSDLFGISVAISDDTVIIGAPGEDGSGNGPNPTPNDSAVNTGAAYIFVRDESTGWAQEAYLKPPVTNSGQDDYFGFSVDIDGDLISVGAIYEDGSLTGVNPSHNNSQTNAGAAYSWILLRDTDNDGLRDEDELFWFGDLDETGAGDTDGDGLTNEAEIESTGTNPTLADTDGDNFNDFVEVNTAGLDPLVSNLDIFEAATTAVYGSTALQATYDLYPEATAAANISADTGKQATYDLYPEATAAANITADPGKQDSYLLFTEPRAADRITADPAKQASYDLFPEATAATNITADPAKQLTYDLFPEATAAANITGDPAKQATYDLFPEATAATNITADPAKQLTYDLFPEATAAANINGDPAKQATYDLFPEATAATNITGDPAKQLTYDLFPEATAAANITGDPAKQATYDLFPEATAAANITGAPAKQLTYDLFPEATAATNITADPAKQLTYDLFPEATAAANITGDPAKQATYDLFPEATAAANITGAPAKQLTYDLFPEATAATNITGDPAKQASYDLFPEATAAANITGDPAKQASYDLFPEATAATNITGDPAKQASYDLFPEATAATNITGDPAKQASYDLFPEATAATNITADPAKQLTYDLFPEATAAANILSDPALVESYGFKQEVIDLISGDPAEMQDAGLFTEDSIRNVYLNAPLIAVDTGADEVTLSVQLQESDTLQPADWTNAGAPATWTFTGVTNKAFYRVFTSEPVD